MQGERRNKSFLILDYIALLPLLPNGLPLSTVECIVESREGT
jgi:hypothetical protein